MGEARAHLDLVSCIFEFDGATDFVKEELRQLRELVRAGLLPLVPGEEEEDESEQEKDMAATEVGGNGQQRTETTTRGRKVRSIRSLKVLKLDLTGGGKNPLASLANTKNPSTIIDRYILIAYWIKTVLNEEEVGPDHIYTCFKHMKWKVPKDLGQGFRNAKSRHAAFEQGSKPGTYRLTHIGENRVECDLPIMKQ